MQCGPIRHRVDPLQQAESRPFAHVVVPRMTSFTLPPDLVDPGFRRSTPGWWQIGRTERIVADVLDAVAAAHSPLVLTERTEHLEQMQELLALRVEHLVILRGGMGAGQRRAVATALASIPDDAPRVLLATGRYIGEGFDDARLDTLFLALPVSSRHRPAVRGSAPPSPRWPASLTVFDYVDALVPILARIHQTAPRLRRDRVLRRCRLTRRQRDSSRPRRGRRLTTQARSGPAAVGRGKAGGRASSGRRDAATQQSSPARSGRPLGRQSPAPRRRHRATSPRRSSPSQSMLATSTAMSSTVAPRERRPRLGTPGGTPKAPRQRRTRRR